MQALVYDTYGLPDRLRVEKIATPVPGPDDVLVRVCATSVNAADLDYLRGWPFASRLGTGLRAPKVRVLGRDLAGRVEAVGANVTDFEPGDEVWADLTDYRCGTFAEYVCVPAVALVPKPHALAFELAATVPHSALLGLQGLRRGHHIAAGHHVLVNGGAGNVGPFAIQIAKALGARVTAVDSAEKLDLMRSVGADHVIDYTREDYTEGDERYDVILDISAHRSVFANRRCLKPDGVYSMIGGSTRWFLSAGLLGPLLGMFGSKKSGIPMWRANDREGLEFMARLILEGKVVPHISRRVTLAQVPDALWEIYRGTSRGKTVVTP